MALGTDYIIRYLSDISGAVQGAKQLEDINAQTAARIQAQYGQVTDIIGKTAPKIQTIPIKVEGKDAIKTLITTGEVAKTVNGNFLELSKTQTTINGQLVKTSATVKDVTNQFRVGAIETEKAGKAMNSLVGQSSGLSTNFTKLNDINSKFSNELAGVGNVTKIVGQNIKEISGNTSRMGIIVQTSTGQFLQLKETVTKTAGGVQTVNRSMADVTNQFVKGNVEVAKGNKIFSNFADNVKQLAGRALLTIPIWIALRAAITGVFQGIGDGVKNLIAFDLSLQKIRNNLQGTPAEVSSAFNKLKASITEASRATGVSTEEIAGAVKQFATLGFSAEESLQGAIGATKLSIALFGDASETAGAFAKALNILIDRSAGAKSAADQMNEAFALTSQLEETNNFEIKNVTEALDKFGGTAAGVGFTMQQTLQVLAALGTASRQGSEGATLLSTSFNQLLKSIPKLSQTLGIAVGAGESTFDVFNKILAKITELNSLPGGRNAAITAISDVFGGARGIKIVQSLVAVNDILQQNIKTTANFDALNAKVARTLESESGQAKILGNNLKENGKAFVSAIIGAEDFTQSLIKLNKTIVSLGEALKPVGSTINAIFSNLGLIAGAAFIVKFKTLFTAEALLAHIIAGKAAVAAIGGRLAFLFAGGFISGMKTLGALALGNLLTGFVSVGATQVVTGVGAFLLNPFTVIAAIVGKVAADAFTNNFIRGIEAKNTVAQNAFNKIIDGLRGNLPIPELTTLIENLTVSLKPGDLMKAREIGALRKQLQKQIEATTIKTNVDVDVTPVISFKEEQDIAKLLLQNSIDQLKTQGALNSEILKATDIKSKQLGIEEDALTKLSRQLDMEKAINEEKRLQGKLSSDTLKLFDIAKTQGKDVAKQIGDVLAGNTSFELFARRGGKALDVFKTEFADLFKQQQALQFFTEGRVTGEPDLRGGTRIAIQEEALRKGTPTFDSRLALAQSQAIPAFQRLATVQTQVPVTINPKIDVSSLKEASDKVVTEVAKQLPEVGSAVNTALKTALLGKQGNNL